MVDRNMSACACVGVSPAGGKQRKQVAPNARCSRPSLYCGAHARTGTSSWSRPNQSMGTSIAGLRPINQRAHQPINGRGIYGWCTHPQVCPLAGRR